MQYHCQEIVAAQSTCSANHDLVEEYVNNMDSSTTIIIIPFHFLVSEFLFVYYVIHLSCSILSSCLMDINMELGTSYNIKDSKTSIEKLQDNRFSQEECTNLEMFYGIEEPLNAVYPNTEDQANRKMINYSKISPAEGGMQGEASTEISPVEGGMQGEASIENLRDCSFYQEMEEELPDHIKPYSEDHKTDLEQTMVSPSVHLDNEKYQVVIEDHNLCNLQTEAEKLEDAYTSEEYIGHAMFCSPQEPQGLVTSPGQVNHGNEEQPFLNVTSSENEKCQMSIETCLLSATLHGIPEPKVPDVSGANF